MTLSSSTGTFSISNEFSVHPGSSFEEVVQLAQKWENRMLKSIDAQKSLHVFNIPDGDHFVSLGMTFENDQLKSIGINLTEEKFVEGQGWEWSEEKEMALLNVYSSWIKRELGESTTFDWGGATATYDKWNAYTTLSIWYR